MSDDLYGLFGNQDDNEDEDFLSQLIEPEEEDFFSSLRDQTQDDLFTPAKIEELQTEEILAEEIVKEEDWEEAPSADTLDNEGRPVWYDEVMEGSEFDLDGEEEVPAGKERKPSALGQFFRTGGAIGNLASNGEVFGLTPQQRMILSIFLFVDIAILGCILLVLTGAIRF